MRKRNKEAETLHGNIMIWTNMGRWILRSLLSRDRSADDIFLQEGAQQNIKWSHGEGGQMIKRIQSKPSYMTDGTRSQLKSKYNVL